MASQLWLGDRTACDYVFEERLYDQGYMTVTLCCRGEAGWQPGDLAVLCMRVAQVLLGGRFFQDR